MQQCLGNVSGFCHVAFPTQNINIKDKTLKGLWKCKGLQKKTKIILKGFAKRDKSSDKDTRYIKHYPKN